MNVYLPAELHFHDVQLRIRNYRMPAACLHRYHISCSNRLFHSVYYSPSLSRKHSPDFVPSFMTVIVHTMPRFQDYFDCHAFMFNVQNLKTSPGFIRKHYLLIELIDKPGQLKDISRIIADCGGNVTGVHYEKGNTESVHGCFLRIEMETRDFEHVRLITQSLRNENFKII